MKFTDEDLKRLKDEISHNIHLEICLSGNTLEALLARLEAAEKYVKFDHRNWVEGGPKQQALYEAWLVAKGIK